MYSWRATSSVHFYLYRLYLEDEDHVQGESYLNRAAQLQTQTKNEELLIIYKVCTKKGMLISRFSSVFFLNSYISILPSIYQSIYQSYLMHLAI